MDRIGQGWRFCWATAEDEQGSKDAESASKKVSRVVHPGLVRIGKTVKS